MLIVALATPGAFTGDGVLWGVGYLCVRLLHAALFALAARGDPALARAVLSLVVSLIPGAGLIILASTVVRGGHDARPAVARSRSCSTTGSCSAAASRAGTCTPSTSPSGSRWC